MPEPGLRSPYYQDTYDYDVGVETMLKRPHDYTDNSVSESPTSMNSVAQSVPPVKVVKSEKLLPSLV